MDNIEFLNKSITENMSLGEIVDVFEKMCEVKIQDEMILFETGTFTFTGEPLFYFSLVRQIPNEDEEYYQVHVDVLYYSDKENEIFSEEVWNEDVDENIFDYIRASGAFAYAVNNHYIKVDIYMDET
ncbi:MAG: hypothetical protein J6M66_00905 [Lachnospiraceae bacterium]|nr:hypothetical protein [Lachnospiraceae bacterium]